MKKAVKIVIDIVLWIFVLFAALMTVIAISSTGNREGLPHVFGKIPIGVLSDSMSGTFEQNDLIIDNALSAEQKANLQPGDVITFLADLDNNGTDEINTHRIVAVEKQDGYTFYTTRGDNKLTNTKNDDISVRNDMVLGQYTGVHIPGIGGALNWMKTPTGFMIVVVLPLIVFFLYELYRFIAAILAAKNKNEITAEQEEEIRRRAIEEYERQKLAEQQAAATTPTDDDK